MSFQTAIEPQCTDSSGSIKLIVESKKKDLGGFSVRRVLPASEQKMVGPFIFFDHMGPAEFPPGQSIQVRPHPHIGIATITYLFEGEIMHHDSTGANQLIQAGAVNLMTAGRGITHSERPGSDLEVVSQLHGIQSWMALPDHLQEIDPAFMHYPRTALPELLIDDATVRVIIGEAYGGSSPVTSYSSMIYLDCQIPQGGELTLPSSHKELAAYVVTGRVDIDESNYGEGVMAVACPGKTARIKAIEQSRVMIIGGDPVGQRHIWWNFVSSSTSRIMTAKSDWKEGRFDKVPGDDEYTPLPE
jgi:redox-sensitive bicupin YhaK (pirin superfamily)